MRINTMQINEPVILLETKIIISLDPKSTALLIFSFQLFRLCKLTVNQKSCINKVNINVYPSAIIGERNPVVPSGYSNMEKANTPYNSMIVEMDHFTFVCILFSQAVKQAWQVQMFSIVKLKMDILCTVGGPRIKFRKPDEPFIMGIIIPNIINPILSSNQIRNTTPCDPLAKGNVTYSYVFGYASPVTHTHVAGVQKFGVLIYRIYNSPEALDVPAMHTIIICTMVYYVINKILNLKILYSR